MSTSDGPQSEPAHRDELLFTLRSLRALRRRRDDRLRAMALELREPLTTVLGYAELLSGYDRATGYVRELAGEVEQEAQALLARLRGLVELINTEGDERVGQLEPADLPASEVERLRELLAASEQLRAVLEQELFSTRETHQQLQSYADDFRQTYAESRERLRLMETLYRVTSRVSATADPDEVMTRTGSGLDELLPEAAIDIFVIEEESTVARRRALVGRAQVTENAEQIAAHARLADRCIAHVGPVAERLEGNLDALALPLTAGHTTLGAVVARRLEQPFTDDETRLAALVVSQAAMALLHARLVTTDSDTGLYNKRYLLRALGVECERARRTGRPLGLLMIDIDNFKRFNDDYGHQAGDAVLRHVATTLARTLRRTDIVARYGGEEFAAVLPEQDDESVRITAERLRQSVETQPLLEFDNDRLPAVTVSIGAASMRGADTFDNTLVQLADAALFRAKRAGRNRVEVDDSSIQKPPASQYTAPTEEV